MNYDKRVHPSAAFSLLEMLVATTVLSLMMVFMFNLVGQAMRAWESGARGIEGAQAARIGLDRMAADLRDAISGEFLVMQTDGRIQTNYLPFLATNNLRTLPGQAGSGAVAVPGSDAIFAVAPVADAAAIRGPFSEVGFMVAYLNTDQGISTLGGRRYYLLRHGPFRAGSGSVTEPVNNCFFRSAPNTTWIQEGISTSNRPSIVDNCYQMTLQYASNNATTSRLDFTNRWASQTNLPAGVLVNLKIMDAKTAARIAQLRPAGLTAADLDPAATSDVARTLRAGTYELSRFIPFVNSR